MKDKLRELAERLDVLAHAVAEANWSEFSMRVPVEPERDADCVLSQAAIELRSYAAILDAEGDGGAVGDLSVVRRYALAQCTEYASSDEATHPARSGVVSDEDVESAWMVLTGRAGSIAHEKDHECMMGIERKAMRAALEHFARRTP